MLAMRVKCCLACMRRKTRMLRELHSVQAVACYLVDSYSGGFSGMVLTLVAVRSRGEVSECKAVG
jgi:Na+-translocating ferredoxin:NAD+ oxidoreductase RnfG subunit